jgi:hypothetical protein
MEQIIQLFNQFSLEDQLEAIKALRQQWEKNNHDDRITRDIIQIRDMSPGKRLQALSSSMHYIGKCRRDLKKIKWRDCPLEDEWRAHQERIKATLGIQRGHKIRKYIRDHAGELGAKVDGAELLHENRKLERRYLEAIRVKNQTLFS